MYKRVCLSIRPLCSGELWHLWRNASPSLVPHQMVNLLLHVHVRLTAQKLVTLTLG